jgi:hypothetical protein
MPWDEVSRAQGGKVVAMAAARSNRREELELSRLFLTQEKNPGQPTE